MWPVDGELIMLMSMKCPDAVKIDAMELEIRATNRSVLNHLCKPAARPIIDSILPFYR